VLLCLERLFGLADFLFPYFLYFVDLALLLNLQLGQGNGARKRVPSILWGVFLRGALDLGREHYSIAHGDAPLVRSQSLQQIWVQVFGAPCTAFFAAGRLCCMLRLVSLVVI
jgi:hypothetical protein